MESVADILAAESNNVPLVRSMNYAVVDAYVRELFPYFAEVGIDNLGPHEKPHLYLKKFWGKVGEITQEIPKRYLSLLESDHSGPHLLNSMTCSRFYMTFPEGLSSNRRRELRNEEHDAFSKGKIAMLALYHSLKYSKFDCASAKELVAI